MSKSDVFHLGLTKTIYKGPSFAIVHGDPEACVEKDRRADEISRLKLWHLTAKFTSARGRLDGKAVIVLLYPVSAARLPLLR